MTHLFRSLFLGGFECSTHRRRDGHRLDLIRASRHDEFAGADYQRLAAQGILAARDGVRWHLVETAPGQYNWDSALPLIRAARQAQLQVIWDLCHYGWPDDLDLLSPAFVDRFAAFARAFAHVLASETEAVPFVCPINEISFFAWAAGEVGYIHPFVQCRGSELKAQMVRASIAGIEAIWEVDPRARMVHVDPVVHVVPHTERPYERSQAEGYCRAQYDAWDMLAGHAAPHLGGDPRYLDLIGVNYYPHNQWVYHAGAGFNPEFAIPRSDPRYRPFRELLHEVWDRYRRPTFIAETGHEGEARAEWLRYIAGEARAALHEGVPLEGICLYPIVDHPGWDDERYCPNGLWAYADDAGVRPIYPPLAEELARQQSWFAAIQDQRRVPGHAPCRSVTAHSEPLEGPQEP